MSAQKQSIDAMLEKFNPAEAAISHREKCKPITFWVPVDRKEQYDKIQSVSQKEFGKLLTQVIIKAIDRKSEK